MKAAVIAVAIAAAAAPFGAAAQSYPARPIRMVVPNPPGGANDVVARIVAQKMTENLGQQIVVDNRGGAGGAIGAGIAAGATPDGYTLLVATFATHTMVPHLQKRVGYDPMRDFIPIALFVVQYSMLSAYPGFPPRTVKELIAYARANPGTINYASAGPGSTSDFTGRMFAKMAGIQITIVPYKGGGPAITALLSGESQINFGPIPATAPLVRSGRLKALAVSGAARSTAMPDVPTVAESGVPGYSSSAWVGLMAPARTPNAAIKRLAEAAAAALNDPALRQQLLKAGAEPEPKSPGEFATFVRTEYERYGKLVNELGLGPR